MPGELRAAAAGGRERQRAISAAVEKPEERRKPERFFAHRKVGPAVRGGLRRAEITDFSPLWLKNVSPDIFLYASRNRAGRIPQGMSPGNLDFSMVSGFFYFFPNTAKTHFYRKWSKNSGCRTGNRCNYHVLKAIENLSERRVTASPPVIFSAVPAEPRCFCRWRRVPSRRRPFPPSRRRRPRE